MFELRNFEKLIPGTIRARGLDYFLQRRVTLVGESNGNYSFQVQGTHLYNVRVCLSDDLKVTSYSCSCPYDWGICKHETACFYFLQEKFGISTYNLKKKVMPDNEPVDLTHGITGMPEQYQAYLCYLAYTGITADGRLYNFPNVADLLKMTQQKQKDFNRSLNSAGWMVKRMYDGWGYYSQGVYFVAPKHYIEILIFLIEEKSSWMNVFQKHWKESEEAEVLLQAAMFVSGHRDVFDDSNLCGSYNSCYSPDFLSTFQTALQYERGTSLASMMSGKLAYAVINDLIGTCQATGEKFCLERVRWIFESISHRTKDLDVLHSIFRRDWFYYNAELLPLEDRDVAYAATFYLDAAIFLYEGKIDEALKMYEKGIRAGNKTQPVKNMPGETITLFLYVIALAIRRNEIDIKRLQTLYEKKSKLRNKASEVVFSFVNFLKDSRQYVDRNVALMTKNENRLVSSLSRLFVKFAGVENDASATETLSPLIDCAVLQRELAGYNLCDNPGSWPYEPVLKRIRIRPRWELQIEDILAKVSTVSDVPQTEERVYYYVGKGVREVEVRLQTRLKTGQWGKGKSLSLSRWQSADCPMDDVDRKIHAKWACGNRYYFPSLSDILPFCKGTDKMYTETGFNDFHPVEAIEEKAYVFTERKGGKISFSTNVCNIQKDGSYYEWSSDGRSIVYWPLASSEATLIKSLTDLGAVPEEAEPMLEQLFEKLKGEVEVQSDIKGAVQLEKKDGSGILCVRLSPDVLGFNMKVLSHPLKEGYKYFPAGKGDGTIFDSIGKERFEVVRDLKTEKRNLKFIEDIIGESSVSSHNSKKSEEYFLFHNDVLALLASAPDNLERFYIEWPKGGKLSIVEPKQSDWNISAVGKGGWFELEGELKVSEDQVITVAQLLEFLRTGATSGQFVRLEGGQYLKLSAKIKSQLERLDAVSQKSKGKTVVPELAMTVMEDSIRDVLDLSDNAKILKKRKLIREASSLEFPVPENLNATLRPYQEEGYRWMMSLSHWGAGFCLADDMGLGKTVQSIALMLSKAQDGPQLVVAPASVIGNWRNEVQRFAPSLKLTVFNDLSLSDRKSELDSLGPQCVLMTTYGLLVSESTALTSIIWTTVILDEAHTIKNRDTKMSSAAMKLQATNRIVLTGTPVQNHLGELWNLFNFINPGLLGSYEHFQEKFVTGNEQNGASSPSRDALKRLVNPFMLRRTKNEVMKELPEKMEIIVPIQMSPDEMSVYEVIRREAKAELASGGSLTVNALAMMTRLRMSSCSASLACKEWKGGCSKLDVFHEKISAIIEGGNSVLVFSQFTSFLQMARDILDKSGFDSYLYLDGSTPVPKRQKMVASFQKGEYKIFLISLKAGGLGLNLTGANYVIHLDPWWNPAIEQQATDRAYRIGQQQKVTVYHLISEGTIEEKILRLHNSKRLMAESILDGTSTAGRLTAEELLALIDEGTF